MDTAEKTAARGAHASPQGAQQPNTPSNGRIDPVAVASIFARIAVAAVFAANVLCALQFILAPAASAAGYGLSTDYATQALVAGLGVAFLMWNATYPVVVVDPLRFRTLFGVVVVQQIVGLIGESAIRMRLVAQGMHDTLMIAGIDQFILWDAGGLLAMGAALVALTATLRRAH